MKKFAVRNHNKQPFLATGASGAVYRFGPGETKPALEEKEIQSPSFHALLSLGTLTKTEEKEVSLVVRPSVVDTYKAAKDQTVSKKPSEKKEGGV